jgi:hypothetical protein
LQTYDYQNPTLVIEYFYNEKDSHPFKQVKRGIQSGTVEMQKYAYEFFNSTIKFKAFKNSFVLIMEVFYIFVS